MRSESLQESLAIIINREAMLPGGLITLNRASSDDIGGQIKVWVSVLPDKFAGSALKELRKKAVIIAKALQKKMKLRRPPQLTFAIDNSVSQLSQDLEVIDKIWES